MNEINFDTSAYDERQDLLAEEAAIKNAAEDREQRAVKQEAEAVKAEAPQEKKREGEFLGGIMNQLDSLGVANPLDQSAEGLNTNNMGGRQRVVAGGIDTIMDLTSKFLPFMKGPADSWDEQSGRYAEGIDPLKKAERDMSAILLPMFLGGGVIGGATKAAGLTGKTKLMSDALLNLGLDFTISATSDTTSEAGNLGTLIEGGLQQVAPGISIPWASRDSDSPDVIYWKNMTENMVLGSLDPIVTAFTFGKGTNKVIPKNDTARTIVEATPEPPSTVQDAILRNRTKKRDEQLKIGRRVLQADPEGVNGYNAFVNEPAEDVARITLDETGNAVEFMADQARMANNVGTVNGRARPILDNDTQEILSRADSSTRADVLRKTDEALKAEFDLEVGGERLSAREVQEAINGLYDNAISPLGKSFDSAVKRFRDLELKVGNMTDTVTSRGGRKVIGKTIDRLVDALDPQRQRTSAAIQAQTAAGVSDIARNVDLMEPVVDTSRLQELMMPRLRVLLKEQATSQISESMSTVLQKRLAKKTGTIEGALALDETKEFDEMFNVYTQAVEQKSQLIDDFVDELTSMAKSNPSYLKPVYRLYAKTNGEVDSMYKLNQYLNNKLGILRKAVVDANPQVPSLILREMQATRTANMINGTAPATAWVGNLAALAIRPLTTLAGSVPVGLATGNLKQLQRSLMAFGQVQEALRRATSVARMEWKYANTNPEAAMARGRADYDFSDAGTSGDWKKSLSDFEEMEALYQTDAFGPGRKALWNLTKQLNSWNHKNFNRWGVNVMYSADGFVKSMMASLDSRYKAYDAALTQNNGVFNKADFIKLEQGFYNEAFDADGVLKEGYAKFASEEIALNADNQMVSKMEDLMNTFPILKSIFMFPRTKANALSVVQTFDPTGATALWRDKSWKTMTASAGDTRQVREILEMHGMAGGTVDDFLMLKSEYIGRKLATSALVTTAAMATVSGSMTGAGAWMTPAEKTRALGAGWRPYTIYGKSYEKAPDWVKMFFSLSSDITMAHFGMESKASQDWFKAMSDVMAANVGNELFGSEVESLSQLLNMSGNAPARYFSGLIDTLIPGAGVRSALNDVIAPQLFDLENNFLNYLANRNRFLTQTWLTEAVDPFTGERINGAKYPLEKFIGRFLPFWESAGGDEPWRRWMLSTGWTGLSKPMTNPYTGEQLDPQARQWINRYIGENLDWDKEMESMMTWDDGKFAREWKKLPGHKRAQLPIKETQVHELLEESKQRMFRAAWDAYVLQHPQVRDIQVLQDDVASNVRAGNYEGASQTQDQVQELLKYQ